MANEDRSATTLLPLQPGYSIRHCERKDIDAVTVVEREAFAGKTLYPDFFFAQTLDINPEGFFVAHYDELVVGYVIAALGQGTGKGWIQSLGVVPAHRRRGVGSNLTAHAEKFMVGQGQKESVLTVDPDNDVALRLYRRLGYTQIEMLSGHFGKDGDRLLMGLTLEGSE
ncbi:GNAT family N-acetyltransferase [Cryptosporangium phraense]|uniref:GNAT family N-acetyltransferase n=1 Tax=Cryptosporangium phraense TaxID=2593070 RepID=A0A545AW45_9ACTN|nr:N-acetyltransferase [Cryptosporangium phraense]TQS45543.1 GNAT family N-acetyltransferase [Cryptosporangium phraense]